MIQPQQSAPGVIGPQHELTRLTTTLEAIENGQHAQQTRDTEIQTQLASQATALTQMAQ